MSDTRRGILYSVAAYVLWGISPLYWHLLVMVTPVEILFHRLLWSGVFLALFALLLRPGIRRYLRDIRLIGNLLLAGLFLTINWGIYIYGINMGHVLEVSLGNYINPLMTVVAGVLVFKERLSLPQKIALSLVVVGVSITIFAYGHIPWLALIVSLSFTLYSIIKKKIAIPTGHATYIESWLLIPIAVVGLAVMVWQGDCAFIHASQESPISGAYLTILIILCGPVSIFPLLLFNKGAKLAPFSYLGFVQYILPIIVFALGICYYHEPLNIPMMICFAFIWAGILVMMGEMAFKLKHSHDARKTQADEVIVT